MGTPSTKKYKANKSLKTYVTKAHHDQDITSVLKKQKTISEKCVICHKLTSDGGTLAMMCGRNEQWSSKLKNIVMAYTSWKAMDTCG